jgi:hypothetical protein
MRRGFQILIAPEECFITLEMVNRDSCNRFTPNLLSYYHQIVAGGNDETMQSRC